MAAVEKRVRPSTQVKQAEVVRLLMSGRSQYDIADALGCSEATVRYHKQGWLELQRPSVEMTEELRQTQAAQLDELHAKLWPQLESDDYLAVTDRLVKLMDRKARLMGLDLERNINVNVLPTAEQFAAFLEWDAPAAAIEGSAVEITDGSPDA